MKDRYGHGDGVEMSHSVNVHKTKTNNQLSLTKTIVPGGKDQVGSCISLRKTCHSFCMN